MASVAVAPVFDGHLAERIIFDLYGYFRAILQCKWNRVFNYWYGNDNDAIDKPWHFKDFFNTTEITSSEGVRYFPYRREDVVFSEELQAYIQQEYNLPVGWQDVMVDEDYTWTENEYGVKVYDEDNHRQIPFLELLVRRFQDRLGREELSSIGDVSNKYKPVQQESFRALPVGPSTDKEYYMETGFESPELIEEELAKAQSKVGGGFTQRDDDRLYDFLKSADDNNGGKYEEQKIASKAISVGQQGEIIRFIEDHGGMSEHEYALSLERKHAAGELTTEEDKFLVSYASHHADDDEDIIFDTAREWLEDEDGDGTGAYQKSEAEEEIASLNAELVKLEADKVMTENVSIPSRQEFFQNGTWVDAGEVKTYTGAYAISEAKSAMSALHGIQEALADIDRSVESLQAKLKFAYVFYEGIDQIFKNDDNVPLVHEWRANNYHSRVVDYVVWAMNSGVDVDTLLFKPQAQRIYNRGAKVPLEQIAYTILKERLGGEIGPGMLNVTAVEEIAYKEDIERTMVTPKKPQRPTTWDGGSDVSTVPRIAKRDLTGNKDKQKAPKKRGDLRKGGDLRVQTKLTGKGGFKTIEQDRGRSRSRQAGGKASIMPRAIERRRTVPSPSKRSPSGSPPPITNYYKNSKPFVSPLPSPTDGKPKAKQPAETEEGGGSMEVNFKCKLKF